jgi:hypothetical protein
MLERLDDDEVWGRCDHPCLNPQHNMPQHIVLRPGRYRHTCPGCGKTTTFTVPAITC